MVNSKLKYPSGQISKSWTFGKFGYLEKKIGFFFLIKNFVMFSTLIFPPISYFYTPKSWEWLFWKGLKDYFERV